MNLDLSIWSVNKRFRSFGVDLDKWSHTTVLMFRIWFINIAISWGGNK